MKGTLNCSDNLLVLQLSKDLQKRAKLIEKKWSSVTRTFDTDNSELQQLDINLTCNLAYLQNKPLYFMTSLESK